MSHYNTPVLPSGTASCVMAAVMSLPDNAREFFTVRGKGKPASFWKAELSTSAKLQHALTVMFGKPATLTVEEAQPEATVLPEPSVEQQIAELQARLGIPGTVTQFGAAAPIADKAMNPDDASEYRNPAPGKRNILTGELLPAEHNPNHLGFGVDDETERFRVARVEQFGRLMAKGTPTALATEWDMESCALLTEMNQRYFKYTNGDQLRAVRLSDLKEFSEPVFIAHIANVFKQHRGANEYGTFIATHKSDGVAVTTSLEPAGKFWLEKSGITSRSGDTNEWISDMVIASSMVMVPTADHPQLDNNHAVFNPECDQFNLWHEYRKDMIQPNPSADVTALQPLIKHLMFLANDDEQGVMHFVNWLAFVYQNPGKKALTATVFHSTFTGLGKSIICRLIKRVFGERLVVQTTGAKISGRFTEIMQHKRIVWVDEMDLRNNPGFWEEFKAMITETSLTMEAKFKGAAAIANHVHFILTTNHLDSLPLDDRERRVNALSCGDASALEPSHYAGLVKWVDDHAADVAQALKTLRIPDSWSAYAPAPQTAAAKAMQRARLGDLRPLIEELIENHTAPFDRDFGKPAALVAQLSALYPDMRINPTSVGKVMNSLRITPAKARTAKHGNIQLYTWRNAKQWAKHCRTPEERSAHIDTGARPFAEGATHE